MLIAYYWLIIYSQSLADVVRSLDFLQWMDMLEKVFSTSLNVLRRMQVHSYSQTMLTMDTEGALENVHVNRVSLLSRLNLEKK